MVRLLAPATLKVFSRLDLPRFVVQVLGDFSGFFALVHLPRTLDRRGGGFLIYDVIGRLGPPMDYMNSDGVLLPIELCGRCVL